MGRALTGTAGRLTAAVGALAGAIVLVATASAASFSDPPDDVLVLPEGATLTGLDITGVEVANARSQRQDVTFRVSLAGAPALPSDSFVAVLLDTDKDGSTGDEGLEAIVGLVVDSAGAQAAAVERLEPAIGLLVGVQHDATATYEGGVVALSIPRRELDNTRGFRFYVGAAVQRAEPDAVALDVAPDGESEWWTYDLAGLAPLLMPERPVGEPRRPRAGERFSVTSTVRREDTGERVSRGRVSCLVRAGAARVRSVGRFAGGGARCAMTIPRNARGKTLRGTMTIQAAGATAKRTFRFRIR